MLQSRIDLSFGMEPSYNSYDQLEQRFAGWALQQLAIQAAIIVGSQARSQHPADEWSDLDLVLFATDTTPFVSSADWLSTFGDLRLSGSHGFGKHDREWLAFYADGTKLDAAFPSIDLVSSPNLQDMFDASPYPTVLQRGLRVLVDKTGGPAVPRPPEVIVPRQPDQAELTALLQEMWLDTIKAAKFIRRQDLWRAIQLCDGELKQHLLQLLEWEAALHRDQRDIWYNGRFLDEWADPQAVSQLPATFAAYTSADLRRALWATHVLCQNVALQIADHLHHAYPAETEDFIERHLQVLL